MPDQLLPSHHRLLDLIDLLYSRQDPLEIMEEFFARLGAFVPFESAALLPIDSHTHEMRAGFHVNCHADFPARYLDRWAEFDPCLLRCRCPIGLNEVISLSGLERSRHWSAQTASAFREALDIEYALCAIAGWRDRPLALLRLHRRGGSPDFSDLEIALINRVVSHLASSLALHGVSATQTPQTASGLLVLDGEHRLLFNNAAAVEILASLEPAAIVQLASSDSIWRHREAGHYRLRALPMTARSTLHWLRHSPGDHAKPPGAMSIVVLEPLQRRQAVTCRLRRSRLSRREIEVALGVMRGLSNAGIALELKIDEKTVKDHLRHIYDKIDVRSRTGMISKVLGLDAELPEIAEKPTRRIPR